MEEERRRVARADVVVDRQAAGMHERGLVAGIRTFDAGHGLFAQHRATLHEQADYFLYFMMDLAHAAR